MKKLIILLLLSLPVTLSAQFANLTAKQIVTQDVVVSGSFRTGIDTVLLPKWLGERRTIINGGVIEDWTCISLTGPKRWDRPKTDGNNFLSGLSFNSSTEVLTANRDGLSGVTINLSGNWPKVQRFLDSLAAIRNTETYVVNGATNTTLTGLTTVNAAGDTLLVKAVEVLGLGGLVGTRTEFDDAVSFKIDLPDQTGQSGKVLGTNGTTASWVTAGAGSGVTTVNSVSTDRDDEGLSISGTSIRLHKISTTTPGVMTTGSDTLLGTKTFYGNLQTIDHNLFIKVSGSENVYRGIWFYNSAGTNWGGMLYNPSQAQFAIGDFTGGLSMTTVLYNNSATKITLLTNPGIQFNEYGLGNRTGTPAYDLAVTSTGNVVERKARPFYIGSAIATIDFETASSGTPNTQTITVTGAQLSDEVRLGIPHAAMTATSVYTAWVSAANTVSIRLTTQASENPSPGQFKVSVYRH